MSPRDAWDRYQDAKRAACAAWAAVETARAERDGRLGSSQGSSWAEWAAEDGVLTCAFHAAEAAVPPARAAFCRAMADACPDSIGQSGVSVGDLRAWRTDPIDFALVALVVARRDVAVVRVPWGGAEPSLRSEAT